MANGTMVQLASSVGTIDTSDNLTLFEAFSKAVILNGTNKKIFDPVNTKITTASVGTHPPDFGTVLTGGSSGAKMKVDYITALSSACTIYGYRSTDDTFTSGETVTGIDDDLNAISFVLNSDEVTPSSTVPPHWYDFTVFGNDTTFGVLPTKLYLGCLYLGRMYIAGDPSDPTQWGASRQGNIYDWLFNQDDVQSACNGGDVEVGKIQDVIRALIPYNNDYLIFGCHGSMYAMIGDPMQGGSLKRVSDKVGIFGSQSWCYDEDGNMFFVGPGGIYRMSKGLSGIENMTQFSIPRLIHDESADPSTHRITMAFDVKRHGILTTIVNLTTRVNSCYWYDIQANSFVPETYPEECAPYSMIYYDSSTVAQRELLIGSADGYIRRFDEDQKSDDIGAVNEAIDSYITFGPVQLGETPEDDGIIGCVYGVMGSTGCSDVTYYIYVGDSPESVMAKVTANTYSVTGTVHATGLQRGSKQRRTARGKWAAIRLRNNTAAQTWSMEAIDIEITPVGRLA